MREFPAHRLRRSRLKDWSRELVAECRLRPEDLILPMFVYDKKDITSGSFFCRYSSDEVLKVAKEASLLGIRAIALFPVIPHGKKDPEGSYGLDANNFLYALIKRIKDSGVPIGIIADIALDPYTSHGHDGICVDGEVLNDPTVEHLAKQAYLCAKAGADVVAPSDMQDGRVKAIRGVLEESGYANTLILSYAAKYASCFYGPFRDAVGSKIDGPVVDKRSYQQDYRNSKEAIREVEMDIQEGADWIMIKPAMNYLDIIARVSERCNAVTVGYQVSGEYVMLEAYAKSQGISLESVLLEATSSIKRAGADAIVSYGALALARLLKS